LGEDNEVTGFLYTAIDISEIKRAEAELRESEQRWKFALEGTGDGLWDMNLLTNVSYHSKECKAMVGYDDNDLLVSRTYWEDKIHPDDREKHDYDLGQYLAGKTPVYANEHRARCKDGTYKWILDRGKIIEWDESGKPVRMIGSHSDISERKEREEQQKITLSLITEQNNRLLNFAHIVSHNLRSHSGNFQMLLDMFMDKDTEPVEKEVLISHLKTVSDKLNETIANLNDVVTIQTNIRHQKSLVNLYDYIDRTLGTVSVDVARHKISIKNNVSKDYEVEYNPAYLESILLNFITNAIKYRTLKGKPKILISCKNQSGRHVLEITDNGLGIDLPRQGDKLFGMYKTFHGNKDARGIGLFITKNQVEAMGGHIEVESEVGKGSTFKIWLS
jgi:PAS domain S-box-containing protein